MKIKSANKYIKIGKLLLKLEFIWFLWCISSQLVKYYDINSPEIIQFNMIWAFRQLCYIPYYLRLGYWKTHEKCFCKIMMTLITN